MRNGFEIMGKQQGDISLCRTKEVIMPGCAGKIHIIPLVKSSWSACLDPLQPSQRSLPPTTFLFSVYTHSHQDTVH